MTLTKSTFKVLNALRDEAVQSRSTTPTGMRSIWPEPKIVAMNRMQNNGNATHTPK